MREPRDSRRPGIDRETESQVAGRDTRMPALRVPTDDGLPLDEATRVNLEPRFRHDFSRVRVHADRDADRLAHELDAAAFTIGQEIFFRSGRLDPFSLGGLDLLCHELAHTIQQDGALASSKAATEALMISEPGDGLEADADRASEAALVSNPTQGLATPSVNIAAIAGNAGQAVIQRRDPFEDEQRRRAGILGMEYSAPEPPAAAPSASPPANALGFAGAHAAGGSMTSEGGTLPSLIRGAGGPILGAPRRHARGDSDASDHVQGARDVLDTANVLAHNRIPGMKALEPFNALMAPFDILSGEQDVLDSIFGHGTAGERAEKGITGGLQMGVGGGVLAQFFGALPEVPLWASMGTLGELGLGSVLSAGTMVAGAGIAGYGAGKYLDEKLGLSDTVAEGAVEEHLRNEEIRKQGGLNSMLHGLGTGGIRGAL